MRKYRLVFRTAAVLGILILGGMIVFFSPPVQRMIVARLVDPRPEDVFTMEHARVGLTRTEIRGFNLQRPDIGYRIESLRADLSVIDIYFRRHVVLGEIKATGVEFDFTRFWDVPRPEDPDPLEGLLGELDVPGMLTIDQGRVEGRLLLPGAGEEPLVASFEVTGRGLDIGAAGHFDVKVRVEDPAAERWLRELDASGHMVLRQNEEGVFESLTGDLHFQAFGPGAPFEEALVADVTMTRTQTGEDYRGTLQLEKPGAALTPLLKVNASFSDVDRVFEGNWEAWAEAGHIAGFVTFERLPEFSGEGKGDFTFDSDTYALALTGRFNARTGELDILAGELRGVGGFGVETSFDFSNDEEWLRFEQFSVAVNSLETGAVLLEARTHYPFRYHKKSGNVQTREERTTLFEISANGAPVEWAGLLRSPDEEFQPILRRGDVFGRVLVAGFEEGFLIETVEPLRARPIDAALAGEVVLSGVGLEVNGAASWIEGDVSVRLEPLEITVDGASAFRLDGSFSHLHEQLEGNFQANLPRLLHQPGVGFHDLTGGQLVGEFAGKPGRGFKAGLVFQEGQMAEAEEPMPPIHATVEALHEGGGLWTFSVPLMIDRAGIPTDLALTGRAELNGEPNRLDLSLGGAHLFLEDVRNLIDAFTPPERERPIQEERDDMPFWREWSGSLAINFLTLQFADGYSLESPAAIFEMDGENLRGSAEALFLGSPVGAAVGLTFDPEAAVPYSLHGDITAPSVDLGVLFQSLQPERPPTLEGLFSFNGDMHGDGINAGDLLERMQGRLRIESGGGIFRLFYTDNPLVGLGLGLAGVVGALGGEFGTVLEIAEELSHIVYDRIDVLVERDEGLDVRLHDLAVISPELHLSGGGVIRHRENAPFLDHPMNLDLELAARGELEELLGRAAVLSDERDELGFRRMYTNFDVEGSLANPDVAPFYSVVTRAFLGLTLPAPGRTAEERARAAPPLDMEYGRPERTGPDRSQR